MVTNSSTTNKTLTNESSTNVPHQLKTPHPLAANHHGLISPSKKSIPGGQSESNNNHTSTAKLDKYINSTATGAGGQQSGIDQFIGKKAAFTPYGMVSNGYGESTAGGGAGLLPPGQRDLVEAHRQDQQLFS
jgi:hypothetical protein